MEGKTRRYYYSTAQEDSNVDLKLDSDARIEACKGLTNNVNKECARALEIESENFGKGLNEYESFGKYYAIVLNKLNYSGKDSEENIKTLINKVGNGSVSDALSEAQRITTELAKIAKIGGSIDRANLNNVIDTIQIYNEHFKYKTPDEMVVGIQNYVRKYISDMTFTNPTEEQVERIVAHMIKMKSVQNSFGKIADDILTRAAEVLEKLKLEKERNRIIEENLEKLKSVAEEAKKATQKREMTDPQGTIDYLTESVEKSSKNRLIQSQRSFS